MDMHYGYYIYMILRRVVKRTRFQNNLLTHILDKVTLNILEVVIGTRDFWAMFLKLPGVKSHFIFDLSLANICKMQ